MASFTTAKHIQYMLHTLWSYLSLFLSLAIKLFYAFYCTNLTVSEKNDVKETIS